MTTKERIIVSAYTGFRMCDMDLIEAYVQIVQAMVVEDFLMLCE